MEAVIKLKAEKNIISGDSMNPFIKRGCSLIINTKLRQFSLGDIVVFISKKKRMVAHRIIGIKSSRKKTGYILKGDNYRGIDGVVYSRKIVGKVEKIIYPEYTINLNNRKNQIFKYFFVIYSRLNLKFPCLLKLKRLHKISMFKSFYRLALREAPRKT